MTACWLVLKLEDKNSIEFRKTLPQLGHNTAFIVGPEERMDNYKRIILSTIVPSTG